jgi:hypothetical protein
MVAAWALMWLTADDSLSDLVLYERYADLLWDGRLPYRDFVFEYPPLAIAPIAAGGSELLFGLLMGAAMLVVQHEAGRLGGPRAAWALVALPLAIGALARTRFDLVPVALLMAGLSRSSAVALGAGAAVKLFPILGARTWRQGVTALGATVVVALPFVALSPAGFLEQFEYHLDRPVQIESTPATVLWMLEGSRVTGPLPYRSHGLEGGGADAIGLAFALLSAAGMALSLRIRDRVLGTFAAVLAFVALGKVLSPQYLLWLAPLAAVAYFRGARAAALLVAGAVVLTRLEFPYRYWDLVAGEQAAIALVAVRNTLLVAALVTLLAAGSARSTRRGRSRHSGSARR